MALAGLYVIGKVCEDLLKEKEAMENTFVLKEKVSS